MSELLQKYDTQAPRYTSYPTVPFWTDNPTTEEWLESLNRSINANPNKIAVYVHIPFCETLCTFCGCNTSITKNHSVEEPYVQALRQELDLYSKEIPSLKSQKLQELHLGGGSPTYLSDYHLQSYIESIFNILEPISSPEFSIEVDPRRTRLSQLDLLFKLGFRRISLGVQDFDPDVQRLVNRIQPFEMTETITDHARSLGFTSVNFDLIYGLPKQKITSMETSLKKTIQLKPDRIAFYSYAHVPWIKSSQRLFTEDDLPDPKLKRELYEMGREMLESEGYKEIGLDHFALSHDKLWIAKSNQKLHRNFMGYTDSKTDTLLGLGSSAISETNDCYYQNQKLEIKYRKSLQNGVLPNFRGHKLNSYDLIQKKIILSLMTNFSTKIPKPQIELAKERLNEMEKDHLLVWENDELTVTDLGRPFLRLIVMAFDERLHQGEISKSMFSKAI
ncbi:oxygen-independent coproporphyrinogen III oxidase [Leptospira sp. 96542]|nr:oxygen-independent coproporphyrinogen III oxidase [Leptospira sp. 96542]